MIRLPGARLAARAAFVGLCAALAAGCMPKPPPPAAPPQAAAPGGDLTPASFNDLPGWSDDHLTEITAAIRLQCRRLALLPPDTALGGAGIAQTQGGRAGQWTEACRDAQSLESGDDPHSFFRTWFRPYRVNTAALVTGYFEPVLNGSLRRTAAYQTPALAKPSDLVSNGPPDAQGRPGVGRLAGGTLVPYWTRAEIEAGAANGTARPLLYLASPIDLLVAQIQGSALVRLATGGTVRLTFDARNGRPYTPIGRVLVDQGQLTDSDVSLQSIRDWLMAHPRQAKAVIDRNESYVFFREVPVEDARLGPPGALGLPLTAGRSAAVDKHAIPLGTPVFVDTTVPDGRSWRHLVLAQDLGSAIQGPARVDLFLGASPMAEDWAGHMRQSGNLWLLLPVAVPNS
jgi:membrane-bound lytic murein transglycosylase A